MLGHPLVRRLVSPAGLLLVAICLALPFVSVSCDSPVQLRADYTGADMLVGGKPTVSVSDKNVSQQDAADVSDEPIEVQPAAVVAFLAIAGGILVSALRGRRARLFGSAAAALATVVLLAVNQVLVGRYLSRQIEREVGRDLPGATSGGDYVHTRYGFWLALALACAVTLYNGVELYRAVRPPVLRSWPPAPPVGPRPPAPPVGPSPPPASPPENPGTAPG
jgi:hypothetical protein